MPKAEPALKDIYLDAEVEEELQNRLSRIEGHVRGIKRMQEVAVAQTGPPPPLQVSSVGYL